MVARLWADQVKAPLGTVVIENQGGGGGTIAAAAVARARPDGYTLLAGTTSELVISPVIMSTPSYDPVKDLAPIVITAVSVSALMVHESLPVHTLQELISLRKGQSRQAVLRLRRRRDIGAICAPSCSSNSPVCPISCMCHTRAPIPGCSISTPGTSRCLPPASRRRCSTCIAPARFASWWRGPIDASRAPRIFRSAPTSAFPISSR